MIANGTLDAVVTLAWVTPITLYLVAQAFVAWLAHRHATRSAREAERLARATQARERSTPPLRAVPGLRPSAARTTEARR